MGNFETIKNALVYIDSHLDEPISLEAIAAPFHFSPYYFHRMFSLIVGKTLAVHIQDRRLLRACQALCETNRSILDIGMDSGYGSAQSFSRAFKAGLGISPKAYRRRGIPPEGETVDAMIMKFTNRLKGGILLNPKIIKRGTLHIAGVSGEGDQTAKVWNAFETLCREKPLAGESSGDGYEIRLYQDGKSTVHVGHAVADSLVDPAYTVMTLPPSAYAAFDVYVANGYTSENSAMDEWLRTNDQGYRQRLLGNAHYCVEFYDARFTGDEAGSIVEIWIPVEVSSSPQTGRV